MCAIVSTLSPLYPHSPSLAGVRTHLGLQWLGYEGTDLDSFPTSPRRAGERGEDVHTAPHPGVKNPRFSGRPGVSCTCPLQKEVAGGGTDPADGEEQPRAVGAHASKAEAQLPVEEVLPDEGDEAEGHGGRQHVEHAGHVVDVQLTAHHLVLLVVADPREPQRLQLLHLACTGDKSHGQ